MDRKGKGKSLNWKDKQASVQRMFMLAFRLQLQIRDFEIKHKTSKMKHINLHTLASFV